MSACTSGRGKTLISPGAKTEKMCNYRNKRRGKPPPRRIASISRAMSTLILFLMDTTDPCTCHLWGHEFYEHESFNRFLPDTYLFPRSHPARGTLLSISCLVVGGGGITPPDPLRSRRWRICVAGSSIDWRGGDESAER